VLTRTGALGAGAPGVHPERTGLALPWPELVFMNPPFGGRNGHVSWLRKFLDHGNGIAIVRTYTSSEWFHRSAVHVETMLFPEGRQSSSGRTAQSAGLQDMESCRSV
jgi:hypothetical protein